jgi:hypothetical protein
VIGKNQSRDFDVTPRQMMDYGCLGRQHAIKRKRFRKRLLKNLSAWSETKIKLEPGAGCGAGIDQSVERLARDWTAEGSEFESREGQDFSLLHVVQTGSEAHPTSVPMSTRALSWGVKRTGREADH